MIRSLLLMLLLGGCVATVGAAAPTPVDCWYVEYQTAYCETEYVWVPGYWHYDVYGAPNWHRGRYVSRYERVRDHRR